MRSRSLNNEQVVVQWGLLHHGEGSKTAQNPQIIRNKFHSDNDCGYLDVTYERTLRRYGLWPAKLLFGPMFPDIWINTAKFDSSLVLLTNSSIRINRKYWLNNTDNGEPTYSNKVSLYHKSHWIRPGSSAGLQGKIPVTDSLRHGTTWLTYSP